jgi:uncharacterized membrane protein
MGDRAKSIVALLSVAGIVLMVIGYKSWPVTTIYWGGDAALTGINNLLMVLAVYLFAASGMKTRVTRFIRHPQLTAVKIWAVAHLLVNGDMPSFVLFGGLLAWAVVAVIVINRASGPWVRNPVGPMGKEIGALVGTVIVVAGIGYVHNWVGPWPFG